MSKHPQPSPDGLAGNWPGELHRAALTRRVQQLRWVPAATAAGLCVVALAVVWVTSHTTANATTTKISAATAVLVWASAVAGALTLLVATVWAWLVARWQKGQCLASYVAKKLVLPIQVAMIVHAVVVVTAAVWALFAGGSFLVVLLAAVLAAGLACQGWWVLLRVARKAAKLFATTDT